MRVSLTAILLLFLFTLPAEAQRRCTKGIPCGNSCISASKVCRIGSSSGSVSSAVEAAPSAQRGTLTSSNSATSPCTTGEREYLTREMAAVRLKIAESMPGGEDDRYYRRRQDELLERLKN